MNRKIESALAWLGPALLVAGLCTHRLWRQFPSGRFAELIAVALLAIGLGKLAGKLLDRWMPCSHLVSMALAWCLLLAVFAGPLPVFAATLLGLASAAAWLPTLQYDDQSHHPRLPWQLQEQGCYLPRPQFQVRAPAPWSSDILHALPQLMSGQEARGPGTVARLYPSMPHDQWPRRRRRFRA